MSENAAAAELSPRPTVGQLVRGTRSTLSEPKSKQHLREAGITVPRGLVVKGPHEVAEAIKSLRLPVAAKIVSADIMHKSDVGGVRLNLTTVRAVEEAVEALGKATSHSADQLEGYLIEEMAPPGVEMVVGGIHDPCFGPMIMAGLGGIHVEVFRDVCYRVCPITPDEAAGMLEDLRCVRLLDGVRGSPPCSRAALIDVLLKIGGEDGFLMRNPDIVEVDLNPVIVNSGTAVVADAAIVQDKEHLPARISPAYSTPPPVGALKQFKALFEPATVAVVGASAGSSNAANTFIRRLRAFGFNGAIYPIHPTAGEIEGLQAYSSLADTPQVIDYAYVSIAGERVPDLLKASPGRVKFAQVISSGFGETEEGKLLERQLIDVARSAGCRILGPNCIGTYSPRGRLTFAADPPAEIGSVGLILQSGGLGTDIIKRGQLRGVRFSGLVTLGNSADVEPADLLEFYLEDPATAFIGLYLEDVKNGRRFFDLLRRAKIAKPVVLMKGGRTSQGLIAASSHTGALAGDDKAWIALCAQTPTVMVSDVDRLLDVLVTLQFLTLHPERPLRRLALFGNGGGTGVIATDQFAGEGIDISPFGALVRQLLEALKLGSGTSVVNPIDTPVRSMQRDNGAIAGKVLDIIYRSGEIDAVVMHLNLVSFAGREGVDPVDNLIAEAASARTKNAAAAHFALVLRSDGSKELDDRRRNYRAVASQARIPVFDEITPAAAALGAVRVIEQRLADVRRRNAVKRM